MQELCEADAALDVPEEELALLEGLQVRPEVLLVLRQEVRHRRLQRAVAGPQDLPEERAVLPERAVHHRHLAAAERVLPTQASVPMMRKPEGPQLSLVVRTCTRQVAGSAIVRGLRTCTWGTSREQRQRSPSSYSQC